MIIVCVCVCIYVCGGGAVLTHAWRSEENLVELVLVFAFMWFPRVELRPSSSHGKSSTHRAISLAPEHIWLDFLLFLMNQSWRFYVKYFNIGVNTRVRRKRYSKKGRYILRSWAWLLKELSLLFLYLIFFIYYFSVNYRRMEISENWSIITKNSCFSE